MTRLSLETKNKLNDIDWLYEQYITKNKNAVQLSKELECSFSTVTNYLKKHDISTRKWSEAQGISKEVSNKLNDKEWLYDQYVIQRKSSNQLSKELNCSNVTIINTLKKYNIEIRNNIEAQGISIDVYNKLNDKDWLYDQYFIKL